MKQVLHNNSDLSDNVFKMCSHQPAKKTKNTILKWYPMDTEKLFNINKRKNDPRLIPWLNKEILYSLNDYGFRTPQKFNNLQNKKNKRLVVFGCSFTFGIGINLEDTWGYLLAKELGYELFNLSVPGGSMDSMSRVALVWLNKIKPDLVILQQPDLSRREYVNGTELVTAGVWKEDWFKNIRIFWDDKDDNLNYIKNKQIIKSIYPNFYEFIREYRKGCDVDRNGYLELGRDLMHAGPKYHKNLVKQLTKIL
jgi:hypothetical protein